MEKVMRPEDTPLDCRIVDGVLCICVGVDVIAMATEGREPFNVYDPNKRDWRQAWKVIHNFEFAQDVCRELARESEDGSSLLTDLLDEACEQALEQGSLGVEEGESQWPEELDQDEL